MTVYMAAKTRWFDYECMANGRQIYILLPQNSNWMRHVSCIYRISFGNKYYIGKTKLLNMRLWSHIKNINAAINEYPIFTTKTTKSYEKTVRFLLENPKINVGYIEVLHQCENEYELWYMENKYLRDSRGDANCLNTSFYCGAINRECNMLIQQRVYEYYRWFYNPAYDHELAEWDDITTAGKWRQRNRGNAYDKYSLLQSIVDRYGIIH